MTPEGIPETRAEQIVARNEAIKRGDKKYDGMVCTKCGETLRYVGANKCVTCEKLRTSTKNDPVRRERQRIRKKQERAAEKAAAAKFIEENPS